MFRVFLRAVQSICQYDHFGECSLWCCWTVLHHSNRCFCYLTACCQWYKWGRQSNGNSCNLLSVSWTCYHQITPHRRCERCSSWLEMQELMLKLLIQFVSLVVSSVLSSLFMLYTSVVINVMFYLHCQLCY